MSDHPYREPPPRNQAIEALSEFERRCEHDPVLYSLVSAIEAQIHNARITTDDAIRLGVYAAQRYLIRRNVPLVIRIEELKDPYR